MTGQAGARGFKDWNLTDLTSLTLAEARDRLKSRTISSLEITKAHLAAIERAEALRVPRTDNFSETRNF